MKPSLRTLRCLLLSFTFWSCGSAGGGSGNPSDATPSDAGSPDAAVGLDAGLGAGWTQEVFCRKPAELTVPASAGVGVGSPPRQSSPRIGRMYKKGFFMVLSLA